MITMVDGVSGCGKSTQLLAWVAHKPFHIYRHNGYLPGSKKDWARLMQHDQRMGEHVLWDRFFTSDLVYSRLRGETSHLTVDEALWLLHNGASNDEVRAEIWVPRPDDPLLPPSKVEEVNVYADVATELRIPIRWRKYIGNSEG